VSDQGCGLGVGTWVSRLPRRTRRRAVLVYAAGPLYARQRPLGLCASVHRPSRGPTTRGCIVLEFSVSRLLVQGVRRRAVVLYAAGPLHASPARVMCDGPQPRRLPSVSASSSLDLVRPGVTHHRTATPVRPRSRSFFVVNEFSPVADYEISGLRQR